MKKILLLLVFLMPALAYSQNWSEDIAPIFYSKCTQCHHTGGVAPFSLVDYQDATLYSAAVRVQVQQRKMPPWPPDPAYSRFAHERTLTQQQINDIVSWVQSGTPRGDSTLAPPQPIYNGQAEITNPDLVLRIPTYTLSSSANDEYRCFVIPSGLSVQKFISEMELIPGNASVVHHVLIFSDTSSIPAQRDAQDPGPGYSGFGGTGSNSSQLVGVWAPGGNAYKLPVGMGIKLPANTNIVLQVHYPAGFGGMVDSTQLRLKFSTTPFTREVFLASPLNHYQLDNGPLVIPPNGTPTFNAHYTIPFNVTALAIAPHMHLLGNSITSFAVTPANDTVPLVHIPSWDFHWQGMYYFPRLLRLPTGTTLYSSASYDNTLNNPNNPNDPPQWVVLGEETTDEMMLIYVLYTYYVPGDENISQDSSFFTGSVPLEFAGISTPQLYDPWPNPSGSTFSFEFLLASRSDVELSVYDLQGKLVRTVFKESDVEPGFHSGNHSVDQLADGTYLLVLRCQGIIRQKRLWVQK